MLGKPKRFWHRGLTVVGMITILSAVVSALCFRFRRRASLELELVALRHQVAVLRRQRPGRLRLFSTDRLLWIWLYRKGFRLYWRWQSTSCSVGRPKVSSKTRDLIRQMTMGNPLWGAPRIHGELLKLGVEVSQATVGRYMPWRPKDPSPTWRTFLQNHMTDIVAVDMFRRCNGDVPDPVCTDHTWP
jgi:putative transposase